MIEIGKLLVAGMVVSAVLAGLPVVLGALGALCDQADLERALRLDPPVGSVVALKGRHELYLVVERGEEWARVRVAGRGVKRAKEAIVLTTSIARVVTVGEGERGLPTAAESAGEEVGSAA